MIDTNEEANSPITCETKRFYTLLAFLLITIALHWIKYHTIVI